MTKNPMAEPWLQMGEHSRRSIITLFGLRSKCPFSEAKQVLLIACTITSMVVAALGFSAAGMGQLVKDKRNLIQAKDQTIGETLKWLSSVHRQTRLHPTEVKLKRFCRDEWQYLLKSSCAKLLASYPRRMEVKLASAGSEYWCQSNNWAFLS